MAFQAGTAFLQVIPSMRGVQRTIGKQMVPVGTTAGRNLSRTIGASAAAAAPAAMVPVQRTLTNRIGGAARAATAGVASSFRNMGNAATASLSTATGAAAGLSGQLGSMAKMAGGLVAAVGLFQLGRSAVSSATNVERARAALAGLYGDAQQADQMLRRLRDVARESPIEFDAFVSGAESLAYMGIEGEQAITVLQRIETAMVASGKGGEAFEQVTEAMLAMVNQGKASAEEINRMSQAGFPAWEMLADHMGMSIEEIRKAVEKGEISIDDMVAAMEAGAGPTFQKMIAAQQESARTLSATWARVKDNVVVSLGEMVAPLVSRLTPALNRAGEALTGAFSAAPRVFGRFADAVVSSGVAAALGNIWRGLRDIFLGLLPAIKGFATVVATAFGALILAMGPVADLLSWLGNLMRDNQAVVEALGAAIAGAVVAFVAMKVIGTVIVWVKGFRAAIIALNVAMRANPVMLIVTAIGALVAGLIYAYKHSETFRNIVDGALRAVAAAGRWMWESVLRPAFDGFTTGLRAIGDAAQWLWSTVLRPVFGFIGKALAVLGAVIFTVLVTPFIVAFKALAAIITWWWANVARPVLNAVAKAAQWLWGNVLQPVFAFIGAAWQALMAGIKLYWERVGSPAWKAVAAAGQWLWRNVLKPVFDFIAAGWRVLIEGIKALWERVLRPAWNALQAAAQWMWRNVLQPIFDAIGRGWNALGTGIRWVWRNIIKPAWDALVRGLEWVQGRFRDIVDWVGRKWDQLRGLLARPINAVIRTVFNSGILRAWNWAANLLPGVDKADPVKEFRWGKGGIHENHQAQITRAGGPVRIWSEPETGGEAYVPLAQSKRRRSTGVLADVAERFGYALTPKELAFFADGGLWRRMWGIVRDQFPRARLTSAYRPGDPGFHGRGKAVDVAGPTSAPRGSAFMARMNRWIAENYGRSAEELIYTPGINLLDGRPHTYGAGTRQQHWNHVHWAANALGRGAAGGGGGGFMGWLRDRIRGFFEKAINPLINVLPKAPPQWANMGRGVSTKARDALLDWLLGEADKVDAGPGPGSGVQRWRPLVQEMLRLVGQPMVHTNRTLRRMDQESGGNPRAINNWDINARRGTPSKGLMQVIDPTFRAHRHPRLPNDIWHPAANIAASMRYALSRYGNLPRAYDRPGGYDQGGWLMPGWNYNGTRRPEPVLTDAQWRDISRAANGEGGARHYHLTVYDAGNNRIDLATQFKRLELQAGV